MVKLNTTLPTDVLNVVLSFLYHLTAQELSSDIEYFLDWQKKVPKIFLRASMLDQRYFFNVANPMIPNHPYTPRKFLSKQPQDIWSQTLPALVNMLCPEMVREVKTYKGCIRRWARECVSTRTPDAYLTLCQKALIKLKLCHFRRASPRFFVLEALLQTRLLYAGVVRALL